MLRFVAILAALVVVVVAGILIYAATKPDSFSVQRSANVKAPPDKIFALIADLRGWSAWSPYEKKDPDMKRTFSGAASGKGAIYEWTGNKDVGQGRMEIIDVTTPSKVTIKLDFLKPFEAHNTAEFTMVPAGDNTTVTWAMYGPSPYVAKIMGTLFDLDKMIGNDFEAGLAALKTVAEK
ncbi:MAG: SRPBCC family protein [Alphaproteobacteria bacterium]|nr:SRPBCC family protein [Alphaproteobacteria bacterium]